FCSWSWVLVKTLSGPRYLNSNAPRGASSASGRRVWYSWPSSVTVRFFTVPANTKSPSGPRSSGRSKRNVLLLRNSCSASVSGRCKILLRWGKRPKRWITATWRWKISWNAFSGSSAARSAIARPHSSMHRCWSSSSSECVSTRQRNTRSIGRRRSPTPTRSPRRTSSRQRASVAYMRGVSRYMLRGNWSSMITSATSRRGCSTSSAQWSPVRRQRDVGAEARRDLLVGLFRLAEPQVEAVLEARPQHVLQHLLGLVHLRSGDLDALELQQHAQLAPQRLDVARRQRFALVEAGEDDLQALLDALAEQLRWRRRLGGEQLRQQ